MDRYAPNAKARRIIDSSRVHARKQIEYATGGPKQIQNLYTREMLEEAFSDFDDLRIVEEEREIAEGTSHVGMSALIGLTRRKPKRQEHYGYDDYACPM